MFRGSFEHVIDAKGRVSIPARFREVIVASGRSEIVLTCCPDAPPARLEAYPIQAWERFEQQSRERLNPFDRSVMLFEDFFIGNAQHCEIDAQGRILVPASLRDFATLEKDVVFTGALDKFRIWNRDAWQAQQSAAMVKIQSGELLAKLSG